MPVDIVLLTPTMNVNLCESVFLTYVAHFAFTNGGIARPRSKVLRKNSMVVAEAIEDCHLIYWIPSTDCSNYVF